MGSGKCKEQIGRRAERPSKRRQWAKTAYNRLMRRQAKNNPEEAPRQRWYDGYD